MTLQSDKNRLLAWSIGALVSLNSAVMLYTAKIAVKVDANDAVKTEQIQTIKKEQDEIKAALVQFRQEQKVRDDEQDRFREAILVRDDRYWEQKKSHNQPQD